MINDEIPAKKDSSLARNFLVLYRTYVGSLLITTPSPYLRMSPDDSESDSQSMFAIIGTGISLGVVHVLTGEC